MDFGGVPIRRELLWDAHLRAAPRWLKPFLRLPEDASPPLVMTPVHPEAAGSYGPAAVKWIEYQLGIRMRWWQRLATVRQLEHRKDRSLCWGDVAESATRRSGKSVRLRSMALWRLDIGPTLFPEPQLAIHTGKDLAIVREIQRGAWHWADTRIPKWNVVKAIGRESIATPDDVHRWLARSTDSVYGYDTTLGYVDESWAVDPEIVSDGMEPAVLERISPQIVLTSTAHRKATSLMPMRIKDGMAVNDSLLMLWSVPDGMPAGDVETWRAASAHWSPARQRLLQQKYDKALRGEIDPELDDPDPMKGFESQYLNRWALKRGGGGPLAGWDDLVTERVPPRPEALGVASDQSESWFSIGGYGDNFVAPAFRQRVEQGRAAFIARVANLAAGGLPVVVREKGQAGVLIRDLEDAGVYVIPASMDDLVQASSDFADAVETGMVMHGAMQELDAAVLASRWRNVGDRRVLDVRGTDVSMLEAVILARLIAVGSAAPMPGIY